MKQEDKDLLLKDLCARLPYETRVRYTYAFAGAAGINEYSDEGTLSYDKLQDFSLPNIGYERRRVICILPYIRPMSSMTEEEKNNLQSLHNIISDENYEDGYSPSAWNAITEWEDYCNARHLDYRGLIPKGLALEASEGMYNLNKE